MNPAQKRSFTHLVWDAGRRYARDELPWRYCDDPYGVYISEVMLQQTQVKRVLRYWPSWMKAFPTLDALAAASQADVLERWQGLGYNRRALALKRTAELCESRFAGKLPRDIQELVQLPGIGPATAAGICAFAYQKPCVYLETNVRAVYLYHFFSKESEPVSDKKIWPLVEETCSTSDPRGWYYALLDYGAHLKQIQAVPTAMAKAYTKQGEFLGSRRQKRAFIVREVLVKPGIHLDDLFELLNATEVAEAREPIDYELYQAIIDELCCEGFFTSQKGRLYV